MISAEQQARDMLERAGVDDAHDMTAGDLVEIATLIREVNEQARLLGMSGEREAKLQTEIERMEAQAKRDQSAIEGAALHIQSMKAEIEEQSRLLGMSAEREARLRSDIERLKAALHPFAVSADAYEPRQNDDNEPAFSECFTLGDLRRAKDAVTDD